MTDQDLEALIAKQVDIRPLDDARSQFYFDNRDLIETWAALRTDASTRLAERLLDLADQIESDLSDLGSTDTIVEGLRLGSYSRISATRAGWADPASEISICIEWEKRPLDSTGGLRVYPCVRLPSKPNASPEDVDRLIESLRRVLPAWSSTRQQWPVWRYIKPAAMTLESSIIQARADFLHLWVAAADIVDDWAASVQLGPNSSVGVPSPNPTAESAPDGHDGSVIDG